MSLIFILLEFLESLKKGIFKNYSWSVGRSVGRSVGWSVGRSVGRSVGQSVGQSVGRLVGRSVGHILPLIKNIQKSHKRNRYRIANSLLKEKKRKLKINR